MFICGNNYNGLVPLLRRMVIESVLLAFDRPESSCAILRNSLSMIPQHPYWGLINPSPSAQKGQNFEGNQILEKDPCHR